MIVLKALMCALELMQPNYEYFLNPGGPPDAEFRMLTEAEKANTTRGADALAGYWNPTMSGTGYAKIIAPDWSLLVHETCHHIQYASDLGYEPYASEIECDAVQLAAYTCTQAHAWGIDDGWQLPKSKPTP